jgi:hypothetical protein
MYTTMGKPTLQQASDSIKTSPNKKKSQSSGHNKDQQRTSHNQFLPAVRRRAVFTFSGLEFG